MNSQICISVKSEKAFLFQSSREDGGIDIKTVAMECLTIRYGYKFMVD